MHLRDTLNQTAAPARAMPVVFWACFALNALLLLVFARRETTMNPGSRYATIDSLVHRGTFIIDESRFGGTIDRICLDSHFLSSKPPVLPVLAAGAYWAYTHLTGRTFDSDERGTIYFMSLVTGVVPHLLLLVYFYRFLLVWCRSRQAVAWGVAAFALSYLGLGYATGLSNHTVAGTALFISFYYAYRIRQEGSSAVRHWVVAGALAGLAPTLELWSALFSVAITLYLAGTNLKRTLTVFVPASLPFLLLHLGLTYAATGSVIPAYLRPALYQYAGAYWRAPVGIDAAREPKTVYLFNMLLGHHGMLTMTPVLFLAVWSLVRSVRAGNRHLAEALVIGVPFVGVLALLVVRTHNYGGLCVGLRWVVFAMPVLFLFVGEWLETARAKAALVVFALLVLVGAFNVGDALTSRWGPWHHSQWHQFLASRFGIGDYDKPVEAAGRPAP